MENYRTMNIKYLICHRRPDRSFFFKGHQFPVCARCTGIYISLISLPLLKYMHLSFSNLVIFGIILILPMAVDGTTQLFGKRESTNTLRFITGLLGGVGTLCLAMSIRIIINYYWSF